MRKLPPENTRFKPGQSGNPNGRPKKLDTKDMLKTLQQIIALYAATQSKDKNISLPARQKIKKLKEFILIC
ncbi:MAG: hypothetical protein JW974_02355 [Alphaproteobacteria bacterium]|nr:hypothetical protein [Alphaproteobacteria bacterium]MBN2675260.1 hypothetical protein [Alphaproteobacteria bacterium]